MYQYSFHNSNHLFIDMKDRISAIITKKGLTPTQFADQVGIQRSTLSHILNGRNKVSTEIVTKIHHKMPEISINWLLFGEGDMYADVPSLYQPSIFDEIVINRTPDNAAYEYRKETSQEKETQEEKDAENKDIASEKRVEIRYKKITKIMVFYSDNTFDTFSSDIYK